MKKNIKESNEKSNLTRVSMEEYNLIRASE